MEKRQGVLSRLGLLLVFSLVVFQVLGCASEMRKNGTMAGVVEGGFTPQSYLTTGFPQVVIVSGTDYEMGVQYGEQAAPAISHNVALFKSRLFDKFGSETVLTDMEVWDYYLKKHDPVYEDWLIGIVDGCAHTGYSVSYIDLVMLMVYPTEFWARPKAQYPEETSVASIEASPAEEPAGSYHGCTTFAAMGEKTPEGKPVHAITSMSPTETMDNVILLAFPKTGASFVSQTYAGRVNGNSAMNSKGLSWTMTAIMSDAPAWGLPPEVYFHYLAQMVGSSEEALEYLRSTPKGGVTGGFILTDASGTISVYEGTGDRFHLRRPGDADETGPFVVQTNHLVEPSLSDLNPPWLPAIGTYARYDTVFQLLEKAEPEGVDFPFCKEFFAMDDWYDAAKNTWHRNTPGVPQVSNSHTSVSQSVFLPAELTAYLQTGTPSGIGLPAYATGEYVKVTLAADPKKVVQQADADTLALYWGVRDSLEHYLNAGAAYLTRPVVEDVRGNLDEAFAAYSLGMDRASYASLESDEKARAGLWAEAMTHYARAQLCARMAQTSLMKAQSGPH